MAVPATRGRSRVKAGGRRRLQATRIQARRAAARTRRASEPLLEARGETLGAKRENALHSYRRRIEEKSLGQHHVAAVIVAVAFYVDTARMLALLGTEGGHTMPLCIVSLCLIVDLSGIAMIAWHSPSMPFAMMNDCLVEQPSCISPCACIVSAAVWSA